MRVAIGHSDEIDSEEAIAEVIEACVSALDGVVPDAGLLFCGLDHEHDVILAAIAATWPGLTLIGASSDGEMSSAAGLAEDSVVLTLLQSDSVQMSAGLGRNVIADPGAAVRTAVDAALAGLDGSPVLCLTTPQGLKSSGSRVAEGLYTALSRAVPVVGGVAADHMDFVQTFQFFGTEVMEDAVPVLLFSGPLVLGRGTWSGWMPVGVRSECTLDPTGKQVLRIGDRTAVELYQKYLGKEAEPNEECPLAVFPPGSDDFYLRSVTAHDDETGSITLAKPIPEGSRLQLTQATSDNVLLGAARSLALAVEDYPGQDPDLALFFSCVSRRYILGTRWTEEERVLRDALAPGLAYAGFYAMGEIGPVGSEPGAPSGFNSESLVSLLVGEG